MHDSLGASDMQHVRCARYRYPPINKISDWHGIKSGSPGYSLCRVRNGHPTTFLFLTFMTRTLCVSLDAWTSQVPSYFEMSTGAPSLAVVDTTHLRYSG